MGAIERIATINLPPDKIADYDKMFDCLSCFVFGNNRDIGGLIETMAYEIIAKRKESPGYMGGALVDMNKAYDKEWCMADAACMFQKTQVRRHPAEHTFFRLSLP